MNKTGEQPVKRSFAGRKPSASGRGVLRAGYIQGDPEHQIKRAGIDESILIYCIAGKGYVVIEGDEQDRLTVDAGQAVLIPRNTPHEYFADPKNPWEIYWFHYRRLLEKEDEEAFERKAAVYQPGISPELIAKFQQMFTAMEDYFDARGHIRVCALAQLILCDLLDQQQEGGAMLMLKQYLDENYRQNVTLDELAELIGLSKFHLSRSFKQYTGFAPKQYVNRVRITKACHLLSSTELSVAQVSEKMGYHSPFIFSEQFKNIIGYSPSEYRKMSRKF
ncbi:MAG: AraC family transcriptional regulator [Clostridia bacterium]